MVEGLCEAFTGMQPLSGPFASQRKGSHVTPRRSLLCIVTAACCLVGPAIESEAGERNLVQGKKLYEKYCQACHGPLG